MLSVIEQEIVLPPMEVVATLPWFGLVSALIGAVAALTGIAVKSRLDLRLEQAKAQVAASNKAREIRRDQTREVCAGFLAESHRVYEVIRVARAERRAGDLSNDQYVAKLKNLSGFELQTRVEEIAFLCTKPIVESSRALRDHLRATDFARGRSLEATAWAGWKEGYWMSRHKLVEELRVFFDTEDG